MKDFTVFKTNTRVGIQLGDYTVSYGATPVKYRVSTELPPPGSAVELGNVHALFADLAQKIRLSDLHTKQITGDGVCLWTGAHPTITILDLSKSKLYRCRLSAMLVQGEYKEHIPLDRFLERFLRELWENL